MTQVIEALTAYKLRLKEQGQALHALVVGRCIAILKRMANRDSNVN
jgi:hypothetical protein